MTYPGSATSCNDGNTCTYGDSCNSGGGCTGTAISCTDDAGVCGANRSCNGTSSCTVSYPNSATSCDDSDACTIDVMTGWAGGCSVDCGYIEIVTCADVLETFARSLVG